MNAGKIRRRPTVGGARSYSFSRGLRAACMAVLCGTGMVAGVAATAADCEVLTSGLRAPIGSVITNQGNLVVSETGTANVANSGRISIVSPDGTRRTLLDGLPQGTNAAGGDASGPNAISMRGRTLYVAIGQGDTVIPGPVAGSAQPNPNVSSPIFSSVLAIHVSAAAEKRTQGFSLSPQDQLTLAGGGRVTLSNSGGDRLKVELVANFPDYLSEPLPTYAGNVRNSNPFDMVAVDDSMYVTNGGLNRLHKVDLDSGAYADLTLFDRIPNLPGAAGPPSVEAVPTGIAIALPEGFEAQIRPRSGLALREGLTLLNAPGTIDSDYRGEVSVIVVNLGGDRVTVRRGDRVAQMVVHALPSVRLEEADALPATARGGGGFGHTGSR
mgnify:CR=1 FL=1